MGVKLRDLQLIEIDKWISTCAFVIERQDGRDTYSYRLLLQVLKDLRRRRRFDIFIRSALDDLSSRLSRMTPSAIKEEIEATLDKTMADSAEDVETPKAPKWNPEVSAHLDRVGAIHEVNDRFLKPKGFVLVLHYEKTDLDQTAPISAVLERWED